MEPLIISFILNGILGVVMYFMRNAHDQQKERISKLEEKHDSLAEKALRKEDFQDFRNQLWGRLDKMDADFKQQIMELKK
jgi:O-methyltransferase involved in polyketide biosynthesis